MDPERATSIQDDSGRVGETLPSWVPLGLVVAATIWLLGLSGRFHQGLEVAVREWTLGAGWGRWLQITREGSVSGGEVSWQGMSVSLVADWLIIVPLSLLVFSLVLARSSSLQAWLAQAWQSTRSLQSLQERLSIAMFAGLLTMIAASLLLPGQQRTEILLPELTDVALVSQRVQSSLLEGPTVRFYEVRADERGRVLIEFVTRAWLFSTGPTAAELVPDVARHEGFNMHIARRGSSLATPLGVLVGLLVLLGPLYRQSE